MQKVLLVALGVLFGFAASFGLQLFGDAIEGGKEKRFGADIRYAMRQLEDYRARHATYPVACDASVLSAQLGPPDKSNVISTLGEEQFQYCSDGQQYILAFIPMATSAYRTAYGAPLLARNNKLIAAPLSVSRADGEVSP